MKKLIILSFLASSLINVSANPTNYHCPDIREVETGNTFLHILACDCENVTLEEFFDKLNDFKKSHGAIPNPTLLNHYDLSAADIAHRKANWNNNPQCNKIANALEMITNAYIRGIDSTTQDISDKEISELYKQAN